MTFGQFDRGFEYIEKMLEAAPLRPTSYDAKVSAYTTVANHYLDEGETDNAADMFEKAVEVKEDVKAANEKAERTIVLNQESMNAIFKARYTLENINDKDKLAKLENAAYISYLDLDVNADGSLDDRWRISNSADGNAHAEIIENGTLITNDGEDHGIFLSPRFALQPSTTYGIDLKIRGDVNDEYAQLLVRSANGTSTQLSQRPIGEPTEDNIYSFTFETTEDIEAGAQEIRFYHYGNSNKEFTVQQVILYEIE
ncbi:MAG: hypothetical protein GX957_10585 [Clostridiaceae bacterium]|nr:hypothetical protein [Clostridiaceae bacterium]